MDDRRPGSALVSVMVLSTLGAVFQLWRAPEPWWTITQVVLWITTGLCAGIGFYALIKDEIDVD